MFWFLRETELADLTKMASVGLIKSVGSAVSQLRASEFVLKSIRKYHVCHLSQCSCVFYPVSD